MERITNHAPLSVNENAWAKLAAYEDTGIPPEAVALLANQRFQMQEQFLRLQQRIHDQKRDNRRLHAERNHAISLLQEAIKGKDFYPCDICRNHRSGTCEQPLCKNYSRWAWKGVHDGNGGFTK